MTVSVGDILRVDVVGDIEEADEIVQVYQLRMISGEPMTNAVTIDNLLEWFEDAWLLIKQLHAVATVFRRLRAQNDVTKDLIGEEAFDTPLAGVVAGDTLPGQVCIPLTFKTDVPRVMPRKLYGPIADGLLTATGRVGATGLTVLGNVAADLLAPMLTTDATWQYGYNSPKSLDFEVPSVAVYTNVPGALHRRRWGRGS